MTQNLHDEQHAEPCIPESHVDHFLELYQYLLSGAHQGIIRSFLRVKQKINKFNAVH